MADKHLLRMGMGFLLAPLAPGFLFLVITLFGGKLGEGLWALTISAMVGYPSMLILGLPAHLLLTKMRWTHWWSYVLVGVFIGLVVAAVLFGKVAIHNFSWISDPNKSLGPSEAIFVLMALLGAITAWIFWLIARPSYANPHV